MLTKTLIRLLHFQFGMEGSMQEEGGTQEEASGLLIQVAPDVENPFRGNSVLIGLTILWYCTVTLIISLGRATKPFWGQFCPDNSDNNKIDNII